MHPQNYEGVLRSLRDSISLWRDRFTHCLCPGKFPVHKLLSFIISSSAKLKIVGSKT